MLTCQRPAHFDGDFWHPRPIVTVTVLRADSKRPVPLPAIIDTGAQTSFWPRSFADRLGVNIERDCEPAEPHGDFAGEVHRGWRYRGELQAELSRYSFPWRGGFVETTHEQGSLGGDFFDEFDLHWRKRRDGLAIFLDPIGHPEREAEAA